MSKNINNENAVKDIFSLSTDLVNGGTDALAYLNSLSVDELEIMLDEINFYYKKYNNSLIDDVLLYKDGNKYFETLYVTIENIIMNKVKGKPYDLLSVPLMDGLISQYQLKTSFDLSIIDIMAKLDNGDFVKSLMDKYRYITFREDTLEYRKNIIDAFNENYLNDLIIDTIKMIYSFDNYELMNEKILEIASYYQLLLRALLVKLNDYDLLAYYHDIYNEMEVRELTSKKLIREAFIANYNDLNSIKELSRSK